MNKIKKIVTSISLCGLFLNVATPVIVFAESEYIAVEDVSEEESSPSSSEVESSSDEETESTTESSESSSSDISSSQPSESSSTTTSTTTSESSTTSSSTTVTSSSSSGKKEPQKPKEKTTSDSAKTEGGQQGSVGKSYKVNKTYEGEEFIKLIGKDAQVVAKKNKLYASVMIAQAALESGYGNSDLASAPNYNLFGIKGSSKGRSVNMATMEESAAGDYYPIRSNFRAYDSYKESLEDYATLIRKGISGNPEIYKDAWQENAKNYRQATKSLTGVYATDSDYHRKLNAIIVAYKLTKYDTKGNMEEIKYKIKSGDTLAAVASSNETTVESILSLNKAIKDRNLIYPGQEYVIKEKSKDGDFELPLDDYEITSDFGHRKDPSGKGTAHHDGIDLAAPTGTDVFASAKGKVVGSGVNGFAGNYVIIEHEDGYFTSYFHMSKRLVKENDKVEQGDSIGLVGSTGDSTGPHLHFAISEDKWGDYLDPEEFLSF